VAKESMKGRSVGGRERIPFSPWRGGIYFNFSLTRNQHAVKAKARIKME
jgi:hypothetical protein